MLGSNFDATRFFVRNFATSPGVCMNILAHFWKFDFFQNAAKLRGAGGTIRIIMLAVRASKSTIFFNIIMRV